MVTAYRIAMVTAYRIVQKVKGRERDVGVVIYSPSLLPSLSSLLLVPSPPPPPFLQLSFTDKIYMMARRLYTELYLGSNVTMLVCCSLWTPRGPIFRTGRATPPYTWYVGEEKRRCLGCSWYVTSHVTDHVIHAGYHVMSQGFSCVDVNIRNKDGLLPEGCAISQQRYFKKEVSSLLTSRDIM